MSSRRGDGSEIRRDVRIHEGRATLGVLVLLLGWTWNATAVSPEVVAVLRWDSTAISAIAFSPDGSTIAAAGDDEVRLWDLATQQEIATLGGYVDGQVTSVAFSPDGLILATGEESSLMKLWDTATLQEIANLSPQGGSVGALAFSPDGTMLAGGNWFGVVTLWDVASRQEVGVNRNSVTTQPVPCGPV